MELRLNKLISDSGLCSRREADKFIEMGRVTVNGLQPEIGQKVTESDIILVDGERVQVGKQTQSGNLHAAPGKAKKLIYGDQATQSEQPKKPTPSIQKPSVEKAPSESGRREHFGKYNKYAAARKAAKDTNKEGDKSKSKSIDKDDLLKEALRPQFRKSLSRSAVAQRMAASPKSASLRKTSRNNPANKAKRRNDRNKPQDE